MLQLQKAYFLAVPPPEKETLAKQTFRVDLITPRRRPVCKIQRLPTWPTLHSPEKRITERTTTPFYLVLCIPQRGLNK